MIVSPSNDITYPYTIRREAEDYAHGVGIASDNNWCSQGKKVQVMNNASTQSIFFDDIDTDHEGEYTLTFFYTNENKSTAYVQVNDDTAQLHSFNKAGGESSHDPLGFTTIRVNLRKGRNTLKIYSAGRSNTPAFDRILMMKEVSDTSAGSGVNETIADILTPEIRLINSRIVVNSGEKGDFTLYGIDGNPIMRKPLRSGYNEFDVKSWSGTVVANVHNGSASFSKKFVL